MKRKHQQNKFDVELYNEPNFHIYLSDELLASIDAATEHLYNKTRETFADLALSAEMLANVDTVLKFLFIRKRQQFAVLSIKWALKNLEAERRKLGEPR
jgi:hypothetical protein